MSSFVEMIVQFRGSKTATVKDFLPHVQVATALQERIST